MVSAIDGNYMALHPLPLLVVHFWESDFGYKCQYMLISAIKISFSSKKLSCLIFILNVWVQGNRSTQVKQSIARFLYNCIFIGLPQLAEFSLVSKAEEINT